jgi:alpha-1,3-rhamnosyl/mannosyltransferase
MQLSLQSAKQIITSSEATRRALKAAYQLAENKIRVIPLAADDLFRPPSAEQIARVRRHYALPERYLLYLGSNKPHKNLLGLLDAWASVLATGLIEESMCLVLAGRESPRFASTRNRVRALGIESRVRFLPDLPDEELPSLLGGAECFVFPSLQEGFGLPPLEAMACGTPVIVANRSSLPEVVGDAGLLVEPDPAGLADGIRRLLADGVLRRELRERGIRRAGEFSWRRTAAETLRVYQQAAR